MHRSTSGGSLPSHNGFLPNSVPEHNKFPSLAVYTPPSPSFYNTHSPCYDPRISLTPEGKEGGLKQYKEQTKECAELGLAYFNQNEDEDWELVEPIRSIGGFANSLVDGRRSVWRHVNFTAKPKDPKHADPSPKLLFAEVGWKGGAKCATMCCLVDKDGGIGCQLCDHVPDAEKLLHPSSDLLKWSTPKGKEEGLKQYKEQTKECAELGLAYFNQNEDEDWELVEPIRSIGGFANSLVDGRRSVWRHVNFTAKPKDPKHADPSPKLLFAEVGWKGGAKCATMCCLVDKDGIRSKSMYLRNLGCQLCDHVPDAEKLLHPSSDLLKCEKQCTGSTSGGSLHSHNGFLPYSVPEHKKFPSLAVYNPSSFLYDTHSPCYDPRLRSTPKGKEEGLKQYKEQTKECAELGLAYFNQNEDEDWELVEPIQSIGGFANGLVDGRYSFWRHVNFTAKPKDPKHADPSPKLLFAEVGWKGGAKCATICCLVDKDGSYDCGLCAPKERLLHPSSDMLERSAALNCAAPP